MGLAWLEASKASQDPEGSELPDPMTASCWISATRLPGNFDIPIDVRIWSGRRTGSIAVMPKVSRSFSESPFQDDFDRAAGVEDHCYPKGRVRKTCPASERKMHCTACPHLRHCVFEGILCDSVLGAGPLVARQPCPIHLPATPNVYAGLACRLPGRRWDRSAPPRLAVRSCVTPCPGTWPAGIVQDNYKTTTRQPTRQPTRQLQTWCKSSIWQRAS